MIVGPLSTDAVFYPTSDGKPMSESTLQYQWIVTLRENVAELFASDPNVLVAADNLVYPVRGDVRTCIAPDVYVAFGRPGGHRGCYKVWEEGDVFPQVVFEVWSPSNTGPEMSEKRRFYQRYGCEEYIEYDPERVALGVWVRGPSGRFRQVRDVAAWQSPRLGIRFDMSGPELVVYGPTGEPFRTVREIMVRAREQEARAGNKKPERTVSPNGCGNSVSTRPPFE